MCLVPRAATAAAVSLQNTNGASLLVADATGAGVLGGGGGGRHNAVLHRLRGPRCENRGAIFEAVRQDDGPHDLRRQGTGKTVYAVRHASRGQRGRQRAHCNDRLIFFYRRVVAWSCVPWGQERVIFLMV